MDSPREHERDFVGWTESQASILRGIDPGTLGLDTKNLAEEIEDLGRSEIRETSSLLRQVLVHLIKLAIQPDASPASHWLEEVLTFQGNAVLACSPGIRSRIDVSAIWQLAGNGAVRSLEPYGIPLPTLPVECPFTIDQLLDPNFDPKRSVAIVTAAISGGRAQ